MAKPPFQRERRKLDDTTTPAEAAVAEKGADTPVTTEQPAQRTAGRKAAVARKPFGVPMSEPERTQLDRCAEIADKTPRSFSTRLLKWAMDMYEEDPSQLPRN